MAVGVDPDPPRSRSDVGARLERIRSAGLYRTMRLVEGSQGPRVRLDGRSVLLLCSNNYLGLADHPAVRLAGARAVRDWGAGAGASRLISGNMEPHAGLERVLAAFHRMPAALLFGSGYLANAGTIAALVRPGEAVFSDELNHASIIDGCRLSGAEKFVYRHRDVEHLAWGLKRSAAPPALIVTDGLFSMDGDLAPIGWLVELARRHGARLMVDEAHAVGTIGPGGRGAAAYEGLAEEVDVIVGTLGKALGSYGAYVCGSREVRELLINTARPFIFSTGLPPPCAAAAEAALAIIAGEPERVERLRRNSDLLRSELHRQGLDTGQSASQIVPVAIGDPDRALAACRIALERGVYAQAIRPPTVPEGTSRLRLSVMATHEEAELREAAAVIGDAVRAVGTDGQARPAPVREPGWQELGRIGTEGTGGEPGRVGSEGPVAEPESPAIGRELGRAPERIDRAA